MLAVEDRGTAQAVVCGLQAIASDTTDVNWEKLSHFVFF